MLWRAGVRAQSVTSAKPVTQSWVQVSLGMREVSRPGRQCWHGAGPLRVGGPVPLSDLYSGTPGLSFLSPSPRSGCRPRLWTDRTWLASESPREPWASVGARQDPAEPGPGWGHPGHRHTAGEQDQGGGECWRTVGRGRWRWGRRPGTPRTHVLWCQPSFGGQCEDGDLEGNGSISGS